MSPAIHTVDPARLRPGVWSCEKERRIGEGDISASYSGDLIGLKGRVRRPFRFQNRLWVCVGTSGGSLLTAKAYRLVEARFFEGEAVTYTEKTRDSEAARNDPLGFYHGMAVMHGGKPCVLVGPCAEFVAGEDVQLDLF